MLTEGLAVYPANHENYDGTDHNPWNEQQCGDHYARAMTAWGALISLSGFVYDGPAGRIGFAPKFRPDDFKAFFSAAEGWGSLAQRRVGSTQENRIDVKWGSLTVKSLVLQLPPGKQLSAAQVTVGQITAGGRAIEATVKQSGGQVVLTAKQPVTIHRQQSIRALLRH